MNCYNVKLYVIEGSKNSDRIEQNWWAYSEEEAIGKAVMEYKSKHKSGNFRIKDFMVDQILNEGEKKSMRIVIGKDDAEITEQDVRCMQLAIMRDFDMKTYQLKNFTLKQWIDAILSHFAKMLNEKTGKKVEIDIELLNELDRLIDTIGITYDLGNKRGHEIISIVKSAIEKAENSLTDDESDILEQAKRFENENSKHLKSLLEAEKKRQWAGEERKKDLQEFVDLLEKVGQDLFNTDPKVLLITKNEQRIYQLEKRVEAVEKNINNIIGIIDRDRKEHIEAEGTFKLSPETVKWLCDGRIDQLEKRVEELISRIGY